MSEFVITSSANPKIKLVTELHQSRGRRKHNLFLAEGVRLAETALQTAWKIIFALYDDSLTESGRGQKLLGNLAKRKITLYETTPHILAKISEVDTPQGIILVMRPQTIPLPTLIGRTGLPLVVLDNVQDPGNAGTIIRTADAAEIGAVISLKGTVDLFAGKTVRSAMGSLFHVPLCPGVARDDFVKFLQETSLPAYVTLPGNKSTPYYAVTLTRGIFIFGNEGNGISPELLPYCQSLHIPMFGRAESLNVSSAAAVLLYESLRQRKKWSV